MRRYHDLTMDLADASLVILAEDLEEGRILSTDQRDFEGYRWKNTRPFSNLLLNSSMPAFAYQALDASGKTQRGVLQGDTARSVRGALRERGLNPLSVEEVREGKDRKSVV